MIASGGVHPARLLHSVPEGATMLTATRTSPTFPDLAGKVALVTGSSRGIGAETAKYLAANDVRIVLNGRDREALAKVVAEIEASGAEVLGVIANCTKADQLEDMRHKVEDRFGDIDLLLAFAGGDGAPEPIEELSETRWDSVLAANLKSKFLTVRAFLPGMKRRGSGSIVLMCSSAGRMPSQASLAYSTAQAGVAMLSRNLAQQLGHDGLRVNAIAPSAIRNERMQRSMSAEQQDTLAKAFAIRRIGDPQDVAAAALF